jgi:hypothetical protein
MIKILPGSSQDNEIEEKLKRNNTKTSFFSAKEVFLRKYDDRELIRILNRNKTSVKGMLLSCKFGDGYCNENDFEFFQMGEFQKCWKFNSGNSFDGKAVDIKKSKRFGKNNGLQMQLYVGSQEECRSPLSSTSGLILYVHNDKYTLTEEDNGINVQPGTEA